MLCVVTQVISEKVSKKECITIVNSTSKSHTVTSIYGAAVTLKVNTSREINNETFILVSIIYLLHVQPQKKPMQYPPATLKEIYREMVYARIFVHTPTHACTHAHKNSSTCMERSVKKWTTCHFKELLNVM